MRAAKYRAIALMLVVSGCGAESGDFDVVPQTYEKDPSATAGDAPGLAPKIDKLEQVATSVDEAPPDSNLWGEPWEEAIVNAACVNAASAEVSGNSICCKATGWQATGRTSATDKTSAEYWNSRDSLGAGQQIRFHVLGGMQYSRQTRTCKTEIAWVYHAAQYQLRNCTSEDSGFTHCTGWTGWKSYTKKDAKRCGSHAMPPAGTSYWGCAPARPLWIHW